MDECVIKLMDSSGEKRTNTSEQNLQKTLTSDNDGSTSLDEVMTMSNCFSHEVFADYGNQNIANTIVTSTYSIPQRCIQKDTALTVMDTISYSNNVVSSHYGHENFSFPVLGRGMKSNISSAMMTPVEPVPPNLPVGYRFDPKDDELIGHYLVHLLQGSCCPDMPIGDVNFWELEPWELPGLSRIQSDKIWYFFCKRFFYKDKKKRMFKRKTRVGHWKSTTESTNIDDLGKRITLRFYKDSPKERTEWKAYEYEITQNSTLSNPDEIVIIKLMNSSGEERSKIKAKMSKKKSKLISTSTNDQIKAKMSKKSSQTLTSTNYQNQSLDEVMTISDCYSHQIPADFGNQDLGNTTFSISNQNNQDLGNTTFSISNQSNQDFSISKHGNQDLGNTTFSISNQRYQMASACEMMNFGSYNSHEVVPSDFEYQNTVEISAISTHDTGEPSSRATYSCQKHSSITELQKCGHFSMRHESQDKYEHSNCLFDTDFKNQKFSEAADAPLKLTPYSHEGLTDNGNQNIANTIDTSTNSIQQQCIQKDTAPKVMDKIFYSSFVSSDYGHENPEEMAVMPRYEIGESSSQATSCCQNHSSVPEHGYFHTRVSPFSHENQEDYMSSDIENQNPPSEVEDCQPKATPYTENQFTPDQTNLSCSMTSSREDHVQNQEFNSSFLKDGGFVSRIDFDPQFFAELDAFLEMQQPPCLYQCM